MDAWPAIPTVSIVTAHGRQKLEGRPDDKLIDLLFRNQIPWSAVSAYVIPRDGSDSRLYPALDCRLRDLAEAEEILLYFNRNVNPFLFSCSRFQTVECSDTQTQGTEYFYQNLNNESSSSTVYLKKLSPDECREVIVARVMETLENAMPDGAELVVGVSGGGDSNALLHALSVCRSRGYRIHPVIIKGIPDWDCGVPRAQSLCEQYDFDLKILEEDEVRQLIGMASDSGSLIERFEREFPGDDFEFMGTLLIRLALTRYAEQVGTTWIATGLNLEDVLCEGIFRVSSGLKPASIPVRPIGDISLIMPLWLCPKRIIDGCFPKLSLDNYEARYPCFSLGRNLYYSIVYALQSQFPGFAEQLARGLSKMSELDPVEYKLDEEFGFSVERFIPFPLRQRFLRMLGTHVS